MCIHMHTRIIDDTVCTLKWCFEIPSDTLKHFQAEIDSNERRECDTHLLQIINRAHISDTERIHCENVHFLALSLHYKCPSFWGGGGREFTLLYTCVRDQCVLHVAWGVA